MPGYLSAGVSARGLYQLQAGYGRELPGIPTTRLHRALDTQLKAAHNETGVTFIVNGDDPYELAKNIGIDLDDG